MPLIQEVKAKIDRDEIDKIRMLTADFGYAVNGNSTSPSVTLETGGGMLLDRGIYGLSQANLLATGVDEQSTVLLNYGNPLAVLSQSLVKESSNQAMIMGSKGRIAIDKLFIMPKKISTAKFAAATDSSFPSPLTPLSAKQKLVAKVKQNSLVRRTYISLTGLLQSADSNIQPLESNGYNYKATEVVRCLQAGQLENKTMPLDETLKIMEAMDLIRDRWSGSSD